MIQNLRAVRLVCRRQDRSDSKRLSHDSACLGGKTRDSKRCALPLRIMFFVLVIPCSYNDCSIAQARGRHDSNNVTARSSGLDICTRESISEDLVATVLA